MKYFLDFESTQYAQRIISIGCVSEKGDKFHTYVQLSGNDKLSKFITELTGITKETLKEKGVSADEAFEKLSYFVSETRNGEMPEYYCYGDSDAMFCKNTTKYMTSLASITYALYLAKEMIDFGKTVKSFFKTDAPFGLKKMYTFLCEQEIQQKHDALEDATMLADIVEKFEKFKVEDAVEIAAIPSGRIHVGKKAPALFVSWPKDKWVADTGAKKNTPYKYVATAGTREKYFKDMDTLVMWIIRYMTTGVSIKNETQVAKVKERIEQSLKDGKMRYNCIFTERKEKTDV